MSSPSPPLGERAGVRGFQVVFLIDIKHFIRRQQHLRVLLPARHFAGVGFRQETERELQLLARRRSTKQEFIRALDLRGQYWSDGFSRSSPRPLPGTAKAVTPTRR